jgi:hypothetical protein
VPAGATIFYCYTVRNNTLLTPTVHTLVDSQLGLLLDQMPLPLLPGVSYSHLVSTTIQTTTTSVATWTISAPDLRFASRSLLARKLNPTKYVAQLPNRLLLNQLAPVSRTVTVTVLVSGAADDQDRDRIPDNVEIADDYDEDNLPNFLDEDADGDQAPDVSEGTVDSDNDGNPDYLDADTQSPTPTASEPAEEPTNPAGAIRIYLPIISR